LKKRSRKGSSEKERKEVSDIRACAKANGKDLVTESH